MLSINILVILLKLIGAILMGLGYFMNTNLLKICDRYFNKKLRNLSKQSANEIPKYREKYKRQKFTYNLFFLFIAIWVILLISIFPNETIGKYMSESITFLSNFLFISSIMLVVVFIAIMKKFEPLVEMISEYIPIITYQVILYSSKKGFIVGVGFVLVIVSFLIQLLQEIHIESEQVNVLIQVFCTVLLVSCLPIFFTITAMYQKTFYKIKKVKHDYC